MPIHGVPTNEELYNDAPDDAFDAIRNWIERHTRPQRHNASWTQVELNWAAANFMLDPEIRGAFQKEFGITWQV